MSGPMLPLLGRPWEAAMFTSGDGTVDAATFVRAAVRLARSLPPGEGPLVNLCAGRLAFALAFAAALLRGRLTIMPSDRSAAGRAAALARHPGASVLDDTHPGLGISPLDRCGAAPAMPHVPAGQHAAHVLTSGSTGAPTAHVKWWGALAARSLAAASRFGLQDEAAPWTVVATVPPQHMYGFETSVLLPFHAAASAWYGPALLPADIRRALASAAAPGLLVTTPIHLRALMDTAGPPLPARAVVSAAAPLAPALAAAVERAWDAPVYEIFGATEVGSIASRRTVLEDAWTAYPGVRLAATADGACTASAAHAGTVALADLLMLLDGGARFRLLGRRADVLKVAGKRASLAALTGELAALDGVRDAALLALDDAEDGATRRLVAFVVAPGRSAQSLLADLRKRFDPVFLPRRIVHLDALPRNEAGKLPRERLVELAQPAARPGWGA